ncbi:MAG: amidohydrolase family protein [Planctomycetota bacterium]|nr:amidohydrolase family protein [Planctomycetota bacterium]
MPVQLLCPLLFLTGLTAHPVQERELVLTGGRLFDGVREDLVANTGIVIRGGKLVEVGADLDGRELEGVEVIRLEDDETVLPGLFDLHAHYAMDLFGAGRVDEREGNPVVFLANGVTSTFPAGEVNPEEMRELRMRIDRGEAIGPRILNSGPYFGRWRRGWERDMSVGDLNAEVDLWAERGVTGFKAKGIGPVHLRALIERAHLHGLTVTAHLGSGYRDTVNPRDAVLMGIDRVEHFLGGDALSASRSAYSSLVEVDPATPEFAAVAELFIRHGTYFDATLTAFGYYGERDPAMFEPWADERGFFTPYVQELVGKRGEHRVVEQFERIYHVKFRTIAAFFEAGGGHLITLGTDHPSTGEYLAGFAAHRELFAFVLAGIPPAAALRFGTINGARALGKGELLGTIEPGKLADLFVIEGDPLADIRNTRNVRLVVKAGVVYDPAALLESVQGTIGPQGPDEVEAWKPPR